MNPRRGVTLIEMLIIVAILAILSPTVVLLFVSVLRAERAASRQMEAMHELSLLESAWRADMRAASGVVEGDSTASTATLVLSLAPPQPGDARAAAVIYRVVSLPDATPGCAVERVRVAGDGTTVSRQVLAAALDSAEFGAAGDAPAFVTLSASARRGMQAYQSTQQFRALEMVGGPR
jgi:type II secretion system protein J